VPFPLELEPRAVLDIQDIVDYYNLQQPGLGKKFFKSLEDSFRIIAENPYFKVRYDEVRCLPIKKFPYMIHFIVGHDFVRVYGVISTFMDPEKNYIKEN